MDDGSRIVAVGLLTERDLSTLGQGFGRCYRLSEDLDFTALLQAIDTADRERSDADPAG